MNQEKTKLEKFKSALNVASVFINAGFDFLWSVIRPFLKNLFEITDEGDLYERIAVGVAIALTIYCVSWCFGLALAPPDKYSGVDVAAIIGALLTPIAGMTAALMKFGDNIRFNDKRHQRKTKIKEDESKEE